MVLSRLGKTISVRGDVARDVREASVGAVVYPACRTEGCVTAVDDGTKIVVVPTPNPYGRATCSRCGNDFPAPRLLGKVSYYHKNPLKRLAWRLGLIR